jgi:hypothetical protein
VQDLFDLVVAVTLMMFVAAGLVAASLVLWVRAQRRLARKRVEQTLNRLAEEVALRLAAGEAPGWALERYKRLSEDVRRARTWGSLQRLALRERVLDDARAMLVGAPGRWTVLRRTRRGLSARR